MTINPTDFKAQGKPTADQARTVYASLPNPTCRALEAALTKLGYKISKATCNRWIRTEFSTKTAPGPATNMAKGEVKGVATVVRNSEAVIGGPLTKEEIGSIRSDMAELKQLELPQLKAMLEKERLMYNIMMLRQSQRIADKLVLIPRDSAAFVVAMTDAAESIPTVPTGQLPGDNAKLIEATANPVSEGIAAFKRRHAAAA